WGVATKRSTSRTLWRGMLLSRPFLISACLLRETIGQNIWPRRERLRSHDVPAGPQVMSTAFPVLSTVQHAAGNAFDPDALGGSPAALRGRVEKLQPRLGRFPADTFAQQCLPALGDALTSDPMWVEWGDAAAPERYYEARA